MLRNFFYKHQWFSGNKSIVAIINTKNVRPCNADLFSSVPHSMNLEKQQLLARSRLNMGLPKTPSTAAINGPRLLLTGGLAILRSNNAGTQT
jgi:hypothetical protein